MKRKSNLFINNKQKCSKTGKNKLILDFDGTPDKTIHLLF